MRNNCRKLDRLEMSNCFSVSQFWKLKNISIFNEFSSVFNEFSSAYNESVPLETYDYFETPKGNVHHQLLESIEIIFRKSVI